MVNKNVNTKSASKYNYSPTGTPNLYTEPFDSPMFDPKHISATPSDVLRQKLLSEKNEIISKFEGEFIYDENYNLGRGIVSKSYNDNSKFIGNIIGNDAREGVGIYYYGNNDIYCGEWVRSAFHGKGTYLFSTGERFQGEFMASKKHGKGIYYYVNGNVFDGFWSNDKKHGKGLFLYYNSGERYEGDFVNGERFGEGCFVWKNGDRYIGSWENSKKSGHGTIYYYNGVKFTGEWKDDRVFG